MSFILKNTAVTSLTLLVTSQTYSPHVASVFGRALGKAPAARVQQERSTSVSSSDDCASSEGYSSSPEEAHGERGWGRSASHANAARFSHVANIAKYKEKISELESQVKAQQVLKDERITELEIQVKAQQVYIETRSKRRDYRRSEEPDRIANRRIKPDQRNLSSQIKEGRRIGNRGQSPTS